MHEAASEEKTATTASPQGFGQTDIAFIIDNTESMGNNFFETLRGELAGIMECLRSASGGDCRWALVTPDDDQVHVRASFLDDEATFVGELWALTGKGGDRTLESTDECLHTVVSNLAASGRSNPDSCTNGTLQIGDFTGYRPEARKLVVLITDAPPGGFCNVFNEQRAYGYAANARDLSIKINAIQVSPAAGEPLPEVERVLKGYRGITCGWYSAVDNNGDGIGSAILKMIYEDGCCNCQ